MKSYPSAFHQLVNGIPLKERSQQGTRICCFIWLVYQRCLLLDKRKAAWQFWTSDRSSAVGCKSTVLLSGLAVHPSYILSIYQVGTEVPTAFPPPVSQVPCALASTRRKITVGLSVITGRDTGLQGTLQHSYPEVQTWLCCS